MSDRDSCMIVGVVLGQPPSVVLTAARFAERIDAQLLCATVDPSHYTANGSGAVMPLDPDQYDDAQLVFDPELRQQIDNTLRDRPVHWTTRLLAGGVAQELGRLADELDAELIVVGTRRAGLRGSMEELLNGSVAAQLAHRQHRPVLVVPRV